MIPFLKKKFIECYQWLLSFEQRMVKSRLKMSMNAFYDISIRALKKYKNQELKKEKKKEHQFTKK